MRKLGVLAILALSACYSFADPWHGYTKVTHLYPAKFGYIFLVDSPLTDYSSCDNGKRFMIDLNHPNYEAMVSTLLLAYAAGKDVHINLEDRTSTTCSPAIDRFMVR